MSYAVSTAVEECGGCIRNLARRPPATINESHFWLGEYKTECKMDFDIPKGSYFAGVLEPFYASMCSMGSSRGHSVTGSLLSSCRMPKHKLWPRQHARDVEPSAWEREEAPPGPLRWMRGRRLAAVTGGGTPVRWRSFFVGPRHSNPLTMSLHLGTVLVEMTPAGKPRAANACLPPPYFLLKKGSGKTTQGR